MNNQQQRVRSVKVVWMAIVIAMTSLIGFSETASAATTTVQNANDSGAGSLRQAVSDSSGGDTIVFNSNMIGDTISLTTPIVIDKSINIIGLGISALTIVGAAGEVALQVNSGGALSVSDIRIRSGSSAIVTQNSGDVVITRTVIDPGPASSPAISFNSPGADLRFLGSFVDGHAGNGVNVVQAGDVVVDSSTMRNNGLIGLGIIGMDGSLTITNNSSISNNGTSGVLASSVGKDVAVTNSTFDANGMNGLAANAVGGNAVVTSSFLRSNGSVGLQVTTTGTVSITNSAMSSNTSLGAFVNAQGAAAVSGTDISSNQAIGLNGTASQWSIVNTTASSNGFTGLSVGASGSAGPVELRSVTANNNGRSSADLSVYDNVALGSALFRSGAIIPSGAAVTVSNSEFRNNGSNGLTTVNAATSTTVSGVVASGNVEFGVAVLGTPGSASVERVTAVGNSIGVAVIDVAGSTSITDTSVTGPSRLGVSVGSLSGATRGAVTLQGVTVTGARTAVGASAGAESLTIVNSTITASAPLAGSTEQAAVIFSQDAPVAIRHSTVTANVSSQSVPLVSTGASVPVTIDHSIVTGNQTGPLAGRLASGVAVPLTVTNSIVPVGAGVGASNIEAADALLGPLASNGGRTQTMLPQAGSPAINAGNASITGAPATDQRGAARIVATIDIGSVETQTPGNEPPVVDPPVVTPPSGADTVTSLAPQRFVDTRSAGRTFDGQFQRDGRRGAGTQYRVQMTGRGDVPTGARAVVVNVTAVGAGLSGFATVHPCVSPRPNASSLNYTAGVNLPNEIIAPLTAGGELCIFTSQAIEILVDVVGFVGADSPLAPVTPARYLDTRSNGRTFDGEAQGAGRTGGGSTTTLRVGGRGDVPAGVVAVVVNVTAVGARDSGFVTVHACLDSAPNASSLNHVAGVNRANELLASVDAAGNICLFTSRGIELVVDVVGYLPPESSYSPVAPARFLDTRPNGTTVDGVAQRAGKPTGGDQIELSVSGRPGVPATAKAVVINVTAASPETQGFATVHPCVSPRPNASSLNYVGGVNGANELIASLDSRGRICLFTNQSTHLIVDVVGYFT